MVNPRRALLPEPSRPAWHGGGMCRNIRVLHNFEPPATDDEIEAAAVQYVRKVSGTTRPSAANQEAFDEAVRAITAATRSRGRGREGQGARGRAVPATGGRRWLTDGPELSAKPAPTIARRCSS